MAKAPISLHSFYVAINEWINAGCPAENKHNFLSRCGLCTNYFFYLRSQGASLKQRDIQTTALKNSFKKAGLYHRHPFNTNDAPYIKEADTWTVFQNPARLAWITKQLSK